ncbi:MAG: hypothetical protein QOI35_1980 [Cryptosporangiaceae bacterium]|jgi:hypothetical protein|nr:hypothetical protein [Cryptosporangiaceae bacterium]
MDDVDEATTYRQRLLELSDFRAAVAHELRVTGVIRPGQHGTTVLQPPADEELLAEIRRLRALADRLADGAYSGGPASRHATPASPAR